MTMYVLRPDPGTGEIGEHSEVVDQIKEGWEFLEQAVTLWRLVDEARAARLEEIMVRLNVEADKYDQLRVYADDLRAMIHLLDGVEDAIVRAGVTDENWRVSPERLESLARVVPAMDLTTERPIHAKTNALAEVMGNAIAVRILFQNALEAECVVVLG